MGLMAIVQLYVAYLVVLIFHELGHFPQTIRLKKLWIFPYSADAMKAPSSIFFRLSGLMANSLLFGLIFYYKPQSFTMNLIGLIAWGHFIFYLVVGSIIPELKPMNVATHVYDDVPNEYAWFFILLAIIIFFLMKDYYLGVFNQLWQTIL